MSSVSTIKNNNKNDEDIFKGSNVQFPVFKECVNYTTDEFWKNIFEDLSVGKCPKSMYISNGTIYLSNKKKNFSYTIHNHKDPKEVAQEIRELLVNNTTILSLTDIKNKKETIKNNKIDDDITDETQWSDIRKKNLREIFIVKFVSRMSKKYKLTPESTRHLYSLIQLAFLYKTQTSKDIKFFNKRIEKIEGIVYDPKKGHFVNNHYHNSTDDQDEDTNDNENYLYYYWDRYVSSKCKFV